MHNVYPQDNSLGHISPASGITLSKPAIIAIAITTTELAGTSLDMLALADVVQALLLPEAA